jgi:serine/threonine protein phosphatase PrpC
MGNSLQTPITEFVTSAGNLLDNNSKDDDNSSNSNNMKSPSNNCWGVSSMQGWRPSMEDAHICRQISDTVYLFCVLDGHGGTLAAEYASQHLCAILKEQEAFREYLLMTTAAETKTRGKKKKKKKSNVTTSSSVTKQTKRECCYDREHAKCLLQRALEDAFVDLDLQLLQHMIAEGAFSFPEQPSLPQQQGASSSCENRATGEEEGDEWDTALTDLEDHAPPDSKPEAESASGTTATAVLVTPDFFVCANAGDSRAVALLRDGIVEQLSRDHKPLLEEETRRIEQAGGSVTLGRVDGELAVSRGLGDFEFKNNYAGETNQKPATGSDDDTPITNDESSRQQKRDLAQRLKVSPFPEVITAPRDPGSDRILVVACDGIWDVVSNDDCLDFIDTLFQEGETDMGLICEEVVDFCLEKGSRDNMTIIVVRFAGQSTGIGGGVKKRRKQRQTKKGR